jgi:hypothetical protein
MWRLQEPSYVAPSRNASHVSLVNRFCVHISIERPVDAFSFPGSVQPNDRLVIDTCVMKRLCSNWVWYIWVGYMILNRDWIRIWKDEVVTYLNTLKQGKVKLSLCFNWAPRHGGVLVEWRYSATHSFTSALDGGEWSDLRSGRFTPRERALGTHWIGGWVGLRAILDAVVKRKILSPHRQSNPRTPIVQPVAQRCTDWAIAALYLNKLSQYLWQRNERKTLVTVSRPRCEPRTFWIQS